MQVFQPPGFNNMCFPLETYAFPSSRLQKHWFSFGKWRFSKLQASKSSVFPRKMKAFQAPGFENIGFPLENEGLPSSKLQKTEVFLKEMKVFQAPGFEIIGFPKENGGFSTWRQPTGNPPAPQGEGHPGPGGIFAKQQGCPVPCRAVPWPHRAVP